MIKSTIKKLEINKVPLVVSNKDDVVLFSNTVNNQIIPIFPISNKGKNMDMFIHFLQTLPFNPKETLATNNKQELNVLVRVNV